MHRVDDIKVVDYGSGDVDLDGGLLGLILHVYKCEIVGGLRGGACGLGGLVRYNIVPTRWQVSLVVMF
jgi:hypothetical protein